MNRATYGEIVVGEEALEALKRALNEEGVLVERHWLDEQGYLHLVLGEGAGEDTAALLLERVAPALALELGRDSDGRGEVVLALEDHYDRIQLELNTLSEAAQALERFRAETRPLSPETRAEIEAREWDFDAPLEDHIDDTPDEAQEWEPIEGPDPCAMHDIAHDPPDCLFDE